METTNVTLLKASKTQIENGYNYELTITSYFNLLYYKRNALEYIIKKNLIYLLINTKIKLLSPFTVESKMC